MNVSYSNVGVVRKGSLVTCMKLELGALRDLFLLYGYYHCVDSSLTNANDNYKSQYMLPFM